MRRALAATAITLAACGHAPHHVSTAAPAPLAADDGLRQALAAASRSRPPAPTTHHAAVVARPVPHPLPPRRGVGGRVRSAAGDVWARLAACESGGNPRAVDPTGRYFGAFQFLVSTWHAIGMAGNPIDYPYAVQLGAAQRLQRRSGWGQWPVCSRRAGAR